ncbi:MAG: hypothetical protein AAGD22_14625 [Verrucomicrobiota bacterium]
MSRSLLTERLKPIAEMDVRLRRSRWLNFMLVFGAVAAGLFLYGWTQGVEFSRGWLLVISTAMLGGGFFLNWLAKQRVSRVEEVARDLEEANPDLKQLLLTAVEQEPGEDGRYHYLQERVIAEAVDEAVKRDWLRNVSVPRVQRAERLQVVVLVLFTVVFGSLIWVSRDGGVRGLAEDVRGGILSADKDFEVRVDPGDVEVEVGTRLVVQARYGKDLPTQADIVLQFEGGEEMRYPMAKNLEDPVFGGVIPDVSEDATYYVVYDGEETETFEIETFVHPKLERADAVIEPPAGMGLERKVVEDTRTVSALEGSAITVEITLNKEVREARLEDEEGWAWPLEPVAGKERTYDVSFVPQESEQFRLQLVDEDERTNKRAPKFTIRVKKNQPVQVAMVFPGRDASPSAVEEMGIEAKLWDDMGVKGYGAVYAVNGEEHEVALEALGEDKNGKARVGAMIDLEALGARPDDAVMYYVWAEDVGPGGEVRRVPGDMYFADVRPFESTFREQEAQAGQGQQQQQGGGQSGELLEKQREVISATWNLMREGEKAKRADREVVRESQEVLAGMAGEAAENTEDAALRDAFVSAAAAMRRAAGQLEVAVAADGEGVRPSLEEAMPPEKDAYAELLKARQREMTVTRAQRGQQASGSQAQQRQMRNLELTQEEQRYEEEKLATEEQDAEQRENLQVLNRLSELARRQAELKERIEELQNALAEAETEEEREELKRQLKRLQEEQEELVRDMDELRERMDSEENESRMMAEQEQLEESREEARQASEELAAGELDKAANSTSRVQEELEELRDEFRERTSNQFAQDMRELKREMREIEEREDAIREHLAGVETLDERDMSKELEQALENRQQSERIGEQAEAVSDLMERMRDVSEAAEESEPLVSEKLYEGVREAEMHQVEEALEDAGELLRRGQGAQARKAEEEASRGIEELREGIDKAAARVLGDEREALRMARAELDRLLEELEEEQDGEGRGENGESAARGGEMASDDGSQGEGADARGEGQRGEEGIADGEMARGEEGQNGEGRAQDRAQGEEEGGGEGEGDESRTAQGGQGDENGEGRGNEPGRDERGQGQASAEGQQGERGQGGQGGQGGQAGEEGAGRGSGEPREQASAETQRGQEGQGQGSGEGQESSEGQQAMGQGQGGQGQEEGSEREGEPREEQAGARGQLAGGDGRRGERAGGGSATRGGGDDRDGGYGGIRAPLFFEQGGVAAEEDRRPITGEGYRDWSDRLRDVEEMLEDEEMRRLAAQALDGAREMRRDFTRNDAPPNQELVQRQVAGPLVELRDRVFEELAKQDGEGNLVPLDRDPVPVRYRELVRGYYERLGSGE